MNRDRTIPYAFRVFERDGWAWLYDDSERTFLCSTTPSIWAEALYPVPYTDEDHDWPEPDYFTVDRFADPQIPASIRVPGDWPRDVDADEAWDEAREEATGNCLI